MKAFIEKYNFYLKAWGYILLITSALFSFYLFMWFIGNHDWSFIRHGMNMKEGIWEGRFTHFILQYFLLSGELLPIFNALFGLILFTLSTIALACFYNIPKRLNIIVIFSLLIILNPYIFAHLYYAHVSLSFLGERLFAVYGVFYAYDFAKKKNISLFLIALFCLVFSLAGYAPVLEFILTLCVGKFLFDIMSGINFDKAMLKRYILFSLVILCSFICYLLVVQVFKYLRLLATSMYNVQTLSFLDIIRKFLTYWSQPFQNFVLDIPMCSPIINWANTLLLTLVIIRAIKIKRIKLITFGLIVLFYAVFCIIYLSPFNIFETYRIHSASAVLPSAIFFGLLYISNKSEKNFLFHNLSFSLGIILLILFTHADLNIQKIWKLGTLQDEKTAERVRSELIAKLEPNKHYRLSSIGSFYGKEKFANIPIPSLGERNKYREYYGYGLYMYFLFAQGFFIYETENPIWGDALYAGNYITYFVHNDTMKRENKIPALMFVKHFGKDRNELIHATDKLCAYPCKDFYYIGEKDILLMVSDDDITRYVLKWNIEQDNGF